MHVPTEVICHLPCISKYSRARDLLIFRSDFVPDPFLCHKLHLNSTALWDLDLPGLLSLKPGRVIGLRPLSQSDSKRRPSQLQSDIFALMTGGTQHHLYCDFWGEEELASKCSETKAVLNVRTRKPVMIVSNYSATAQLILSLFVKQNLMRRLQLSSEDGLCFWVRSSPHHPIIIVIVYHFCRDS